ncbi:MAG: 50S ribosomal protein L3, partial [Proteobacteria bacterium]|nr:50S ribosomal protein L3 [Pseudomonadota bacterium]
GGGGGSQPVRQVGSIGDVVSNKVNKGMTMPGQMGNKQVTVQNLEIVAIDVENNSILVRGSIPGPNKSFVVVRAAVKGLPSKDAQVLVDVKEAQEKNHLLEEAKKVGADINTNMSLEEMKSKLKEAKEAKLAEENKEDAKGGE